MADFCGLPLDVKILIFAQLPRTDLKAICQTCRDLYNTGVPFLYNTICVPHTVSTRTVSRLLNPGNSGLKHVRHLRITTPWKSGIADLKHANTVLEMFANALPRDTLTTAMCVL